MFEPEGVFGGVVGGPSALYWPVRGATQNNSEDPLFFFPIQSFVSCPVPERLAGQIPHYPSLFRPWAGR